MFPSEGNFYTASSIGRYGNAFSVTGLWSMNKKHTMHLTLASGSLWRKQMSVCGHTRAPMEHVILFLSSGDFVSEVWVLWNALGGVPTPDDTHDLYVGRRARALCSRGNGVHSLWAFFFGKSSALVCPFSRENWGDHLPPAARVQPLLRQWGDWVGGDSQLELANEFERGIFHLALVSGWRE